MPNNNPLPVPVPAPAPVTLSTEDMVTKALRSAQGGCISLVALPDSRYPELPATHTVAVYMGGHSEAFSGVTLQDALVAAVTGIAAERERVLRGRIQELQKMLDDTNQALAAVVDLGKVKP